MKVYSLSRLSVVLEKDRKTIQRVARKINAKIVTKLKASYIEEKDAECLIATIKPELNRQNIKQILESV